MEGSDGVTSETDPRAATAEREEELRDFLSNYWNSLMAGDMEAFAPLVADRCIVHYPGNHFLSGDYVGQEAIVDLYSKLYRIGIEQGTFIGEFVDGVTSKNHACAIIRYRIVIGAGREIAGEAIGRFHIENGQMVEYWLFERDQKMINDIIKMSGKALLAGGSKLDMARGVLTHPAALIRTVRRIGRAKRGKITRSL
jgi:hypothetical protein